jgi:DNA-binding transcriptional MerR regulator
MKIGELARQAGVTIDTVRFYERRGVLPAPARRPSGYRDYGTGTVRRLQLARRMQALGLSLDEIVEALAAHDAGRATCASERWRLDAALERVTARIAELQALRREIAAARAACRRGRCRILSAG